MISMFKINDRVRRLEDRQVTGATVADIRGGLLLLAYDEGGEGWWPESSVEPIAPVGPQPEWVAFGVAVMTDSGIKTLLNQAIAMGESPLALGLASGLSDAAKGDSKVFLGHDGIPGTWEMALGSGLVSPALAAHVQSLAVLYNLPAEFVERLNP